MDRINSPTRVIDKHGPGKDGWRDGTDAPGLPPTRGNAAFYDGVQEELLSVIEGVGLMKPSANELNQLFKSMKLLDLFNALTNVRKIAVQKITGEAATAILDVAYGIDAGADREGVFCLAGLYGDNAVTAITRGFSGETAIFAEHGSGHITGVVLANELWVFVGYDPATFAARIWTAPKRANVLDLTSRTPPASTEEPLRKVCFNGTVVCAVGSYSGAGADNAQICTASDPTGTWTKRAPAGGSTTSFSSCAARRDTGVIIIGGSGLAGGEMQRSTDHGATWTSVYSIAGAGSGIGSISHVEGNVWLAVQSTAGAATQKILRSIDDGLTWGDVTLEGEIELGGTDPGVHCAGFTRVGTALVAVMYAHGKTNRAHFCVSIDQGLTWRPCGSFGIRRTGIVALWGPIASDGRQVIALDTLQNHTRVIASKAISHGFAP